MNKRMKWVWICLISMWVFMLANLIVKELSQIAGIILLCCAYACVIATTVLLIVEYIKKTKEFDKLIRELYKEIEIIEKDHSNVNKD